MLKGVELRSGGKDHLRLGSGRVEEYLFNILEFFGKL